MSRINKIIPLDQYEPFVKYLASKLQVDVELVIKTVTEYSFLEVKLPLEDSHLLLFCKAWVEKIPLLKRYSAQELLSYFKKEEAVKALADYATQGLESYCEGLVDVLVNHPEIPSGLKMPEACKLLSEVFVETCRSPALCGRAAASEEKTVRQEVPETVNQPEPVSTRNEVRDLGDPSEHASALLASLNRERISRDVNKSKNTVIEELFAPLEDRVEKIRESRKYELPSDDKDVDRQSPDGDFVSSETTLPINSEVRDLVGKGGPIPPENVAKLRYRQESERKASTSQRESADRKEKSIFGSSTSEEEEKPKKPKKPTKQTKQTKQAARKRAPSESSSKSSSSSDSSSESELETKTKTKTKSKKGKVPARKSSTKKVPAKKGKSKKSSSSSSDSTSSESTSSELSSISSSSSEEVSKKKISRKR